jgi:ADP-ribose pyrophosphatase
VARKSKWAKPVGAELGWRRKETEIVYRDQVLRLRRDTIEKPSGKETHFAYLERTDAVIIVPLTSSGQMILIDQYRYAIDQWSLELPAGGMDDKPNESLEEVARAELREEVGGVSDRWTHVATFFSATSLTDERCQVFLAENVVLSSAEAEPSEKIKLHPMPIGEVLALVRRGEMKDGQCALAILLCEPLLRERGNLGPGHSA